ncbi:MAG: carboxypeptidase-like regulatory domain-containing protein [Blastocatellia bacterium]|nr:carboxypeptidase-like regulatory domain-containing protein [Blastocatellia bacterium]
MRLRMILLISLLALASLAGAAQRAGGRITGRIVSDDGQPLRGAMVHAIGLDVTGREGQAARQSVAADEDGNFAIENLDAVPYLVSASMPGYVAAQSIGVDEPRYARVGESLTITLTRGGVITGRVTNAAGEPVVRINIRAIPVRDEAGKPYNAPPAFQLMTSSTDDRGIYRIYGLPAGSYLVGTDGGRDFSIRATPFAGRASTFYPSATRDTAVEVKVARGGEAAGIDIRYRGEAGVSISGKVAGLPPQPKSGIQMAGSQITLRDPASSVVLDATYLAPFSGETDGYAFHGVLNGEYELRASWGGPGSENLLVSPARRVIVKGQGLTGVDLALAPLASIAGTIAIESLPEGLKCEGARAFAPEEIVLLARRDESAEKAEPFSPIFDGARPVGVPDEKGAFRIRNLMPGRHRIEASLPDERWFLKAMTIAPPAPDPRNGIVVKTGERVAGLRLTIGAGAAAVRGKVEAAAGARLPNRLRVHLLPAEADAKDDLLRYFETAAGADGVFSFAHLAPGRYLLLVRPAAVEPAPRDAAERARLRKEAEAANIPLDLKACQRVQSQISYRER